MALVLGAVVGLLLASLVLNGALWYFRYSSANYWRDQAREQADARKATELRSSEQIDAMLDRVQASPTLTLARPQASGLTQERTYIPDTPEADADWNDYRGDPVEDE